MRKRREFIRHGLAICVSLAALKATVVAQQATPTRQEIEKPHAWSLKVYRYPAQPLLMGFEPEGRGVHTAPPMPSSTATPDEIVTFLKRSHEVVNLHLRLESVTLPKGSLAVFDPQSHTLVIRTTNAMHNRIEGLAASYMTVLPQYLAFSVRVLEADGKVIRELLKEATAKPEHQAALARLDSLVIQGQAKYLGTLRVDTRSGQHVTVNSATDFCYLTEQTVDARDLAATTQESRQVGTLVEIDPVIGPDGATIDVNMSLEHHHAAPTMRWVASGQRGARAIESPTPDFHVSKVSTATTLISGGTKLVGVWKPDGPGSEPPADRLQVAFLKGDAVSMLPAPDKRLEGFVSTYGGKVEPMPKEPATEPVDVPPGMERRSYRTPRGFLSATMSPPVPVDPIGMTPPPWQAPRVTVLEVLKAQGIPFPAGAYANFNPSSGEMVVCNTPEALALVDAYVSVIMDTNSRVVVTTIQVVQADGATLRRIEADTAGISDHTAAWELMEKEIAAGRAKALRTLWLETRSGQRATCEAGTEHLFAEGSDYDGSSGGHTNSDKTTTVNNFTISTGGSLPLSTSFDMRKVGLGLELDPVIGPDGITVDLNTSFYYDYAPPTMLREPMMADDKVFRFSPPGLGFHKANISTTVTLHSGQRRLLGLWKPTGTPEFEGADVLQAAFIRVDIVAVK